MLKSKAKTQRLWDSNELNMWYLRELGSDITNNNNSNNSNNNNQSNNNDNNAEIERGNTNEEELYV